MTIIGLVPIARSKIPKDDRVDPSGPKEGPLPMPDKKSGLTALAIIAILSGPTLAQSPTPGVATGAYPASQSPGNLSAYYGMTPNFANYGLSGTYPTRGGYGYQGYGPGAQFGAHYTPTTAGKPQPKPIAPKPASKPAGSLGTTKGVGRPRKGL
jgi:hypothetical protein